MTTHAYVSKNNKDDATLEQRNEELEKKLNNVKEENNRLKDVLNEVYVNRYSGLEIKRIVLNAQLDREC